MQPGSPGCRSMAPARLLTGLLTGADDTTDDPYASTCIQVMIQACNGDRESPSADRSVRPSPPCTRLRCQLSYANTGAASHGSGGAGYLICLSLALICCFCPHTAHSPCQLQNPSWPQIKKLLASAATGDLGYSCRRGFPSVHVMPCSQVAH